MIDKNPLILSQEFNDVLDLLENTNENVFLTGRAGTGKSTLLQLFKNTTKKNVVVLAPTGIAALNVGGQTIHSFFGFPPRIIHAEDIPKKAKKARQVYEKMDTLVIDEISMVRADLLDNINFFLQINREINLPFGGVQVILIGDMFQLPPVVSSIEEKNYFQIHYSSPYFFSSAVIKSGFDLQMIELTKVYRQEEKFFLKLLDEIRLKQLDLDGLTELNRRHHPTFESSDLYITLTTQNAMAEQLNIKKLDEINNPEVIFQGSITGRFDANLYPTDLALKLKVGAQVMFIRNDTKKQFVNGTIGKVVGLKPNLIKVELPNGNILEVEKIEWEIKKYVMKPDNPQQISTEVVGTFTQYPLKLSWAMTIHKSQGKTFDRVIIDLGNGAFEHGQTYVALSRCRTLEGVVLKKLMKYTDIKVDERIVEFYETNFR